MSLDTPRALASRVLGRLTPARMTTDDRGRTVEVVTGSAEGDGFPAVDDEGEPTPFAPRPDEPGDADPPPKRHSAWARVKGGGGCALALAALIWWLALFVEMLWKLGTWLAGVFGWPAWAGLPLVIVTLAAGIWVIVLLNSFRRDPKASRAPLAWRVPHAHCGACGYNLAGMAPEADGCTVCAECGAAWNIAEWREDFPQPAPARQEAPSDDARRWSRTEYIINDARGGPQMLMARQSFEVARARVIDRATRDRGAVLRSWSGALVGGVMMCSAVLAAVLAPGPAHGAWVMVGLLGFIAGAIPLVRAPWSGKRARRRAAREIADEMVGRGVCPACESALAERPARFDGTRVCPACGAAWQAGFSRRRARSFRLSEE